MRKKIFIIHGKGVSRGIGKEGGGDLDTVGSNAFYMVWAENALKEELGREPVYGEDYEFDFLNYSEGVGHLIVHSGCDIYIPDFPIDALVPRLKMLLIEEEESIELLNRFTQQINDFKLWIVRNADKVGDDIKDIFNATFKQIPKVLEHQERAPLLAALNILKLTRYLVELDVLSAESGEAECPDFLPGFRKGMIANMTGPKLQDLKKALKVQLDDKNKEKMIDLITDRESIIAFDEAIKKDLSTNGRVNYTDELIILMVEMVAYVIRGMKQLRDLPWKEKPKHDYSLTLRAILDDLRRHLRVMIALADTMPGEASEKLKSLVNGITATCNNTLEILTNIQNYVPPPRAEEKEFNICVILTEEATGKAVPDIEIVVKRLKGKGSFILPDGSSQAEETVLVKTNGQGVARLKYVPSTPEEEYLFSLTFDELQEVLIPSEIPPPDEEFETILDEVSEELGEETLEEKEAEKPEAAERAMQVALTLIERQFRDLKENDVRIASIDDHHPYTQAIFDLLQKLEGEGIIGQIQIASLPRGQELPIEEQKCGADLIYKDRIQGKPWDNPGLAELVRIAHLQDLHIEIEPLALELSKLIGSKFGKIEMAQGLASRIKDYDSLRNIMEAAGWDKLVQAYEEGLERVLHRTEQNLGRIVYHKPQNPEEKVRIMVGISPFCNAKKGEVQINVASAINYLMGGKGYPADYMFYCYGSHLMTTRKPNEEETSLNLSTMCQHIGTKADGGHSGAATCKPASNPAFPLKRLDKVRDTNFLEFLEYLAKKVVGYSGLELEEAAEVKVEEYTEPVERALAHVRENTFEIALQRKEKPDDTLRVLFTRAPKVNRKAGEEKPTFLQVLNYLKRHQTFDYLIFSQGMLYRVVLCNAGDPRKRLDLPRLARIIGWSEDGGCDKLAIADIKKNKSVKKRLRRLLNPHLVQLAFMMAKFIEEGSDYRPVSVKPLLFGGVEKDAAPVCNRLDANTYVIDLSSSGGEGKADSLRLVATLSPPVNREAGESEPSLALAADHFKKLNPNYLIYSEHELSFPREQQISVLLRVDDPSRSINCAEAVAALAGEVYCGIEEVAECMPGFLEESPLAETDLSPHNYKEFLDFIVPRIAEASGYSVDQFRPLSEE